MNLHNIFTVYLKELKDTLRDRRSLMSMIIIPTFVMPALTFGVGKIAAGVVSKAREETPAVMIVGGDDSPGVAAALRQDKKLKVVPTAADWKQQISDKKVRAAVLIPAGFEAGLKAGAADPVVIYNYDGELKSGFAVSELEKFFRDLRDQTVTARLAERALPATLVKPFDLRRENVAAPEKVGGNLLGGIVPYLIIILCFTGAMYPAMDLTAGEKERGTMETLLCSPVARVDLVLGKFLMVLTGSLSAMLLSLTSMGLSAMAAGMMFGGGGGAKLAAAAMQAKAAGTAMPMIDPVGLLGVVGMVLPVAVLFSAVIFTVALFAKSYKEAQSYVAPMVFLIIMPAVVGMLPGIDLNARLALVPILNLSLVCKEMLSGIWHWNYIVLIFGSSCVYAAVALTLAVKMFNREDVIFRA
ncbi:MAG: sodium transport system permease protein [Verrucomicrobia bacterium]|jgi:sodium transport system permease protein|nr:MAG: sodium transport system permease protein [Verrucomicrobiota bacterium]